MPGGILIFGANGSGKSTLGKELSRLLECWYMDIEDYHFVKSDIPYSAVRSREECLALMLEDMQKHSSFVLSAVTGDFGDRISAMYECAVYMAAPPDIRLERVKQRAFKQHGERVLEGGDMFEREQRFFDFVASRPMAEIDQWAQTLPCPVLHADGTKPVQENAEWIASWYQTLTHKSR